MEENIRKFRVCGDKKIELSNYSSSYSAHYSKEDSAKALNKYKLEMEELQEKLYATNRYSLLIIFQAMDAAGKDSAIEHVMSGVNPQGCQVYSFKQPNAEEYKHDFLWRHYKNLPEKGRIGIHNRSHYENVLICKVHPELVLKEGIANISTLDSLNPHFWKARYESILDFEKHLFRNGTILIKFFLHISKDEQKKRFLSRIDDPLKNWKFSAFDVEERKYWHEYMKAYEEAINATATKDSPWYIIPADKKWFARLAIGEIIADTLKSLDLKLPKPPKEEKNTLAECKQLLLNEKK
ncbi:MAG TPA: polyphosphate kinase 2 family protein [Daejeonella sp.]|nr:polyphosphate kinase 2 family protein [Daejeonella sp.]